jgi:hypothetical protein
MPIALTQEEFKARCDEYHPGNDHSDLDFTGMNKYVTPICPIHGSWRTLASNYASPSTQKRCAKCAGNAPLSPDEFKSRCDEYHPGNDHSDLDFTGVDNYITPICPVHGQWLTRAYSYASPRAQHGCLKCHHDKLTMAAAEFKAHCDEYHPQNDHSDLDYTAVHNYITPICPVPGHGQWRTLANSYARPSSQKGCPSCAKFNFDPNKPAILYGFWIDGLYKAGITNRTVEDRYQVRDFKRMSEITLIPFEIGQDAWDAEAAIKREFKDYLTKRTDKVFSCNTGNSELFEINVLKYVA